MLTDVGPVEISVPRDRDGSFEPKIVKKRQQRLTGVDEMVISLSAKGLTTGEVQAHLAEVYGTEVSRRTISTITEKVGPRRRLASRDPDHRIRPAGTFVGVSTDFQRAREVLGARLRELRDGTGLTGKDFAA